MDEALTTGQELGGQVRRGQRSDEVRDWAASHLTGFPVAGRDPGGPAWGAERRCPGRAGGAEAAAAERPAGRGGAGGGAFVEAGRLSSGQRVAPAALPLHLWKWLRMDPRPLEEMLGLVTAGGSALVCAPSGFLPRAEGQARGSARAGATRSPEDYLPGRRLGVASGTPPPPEEGSARTCVSLSSDAQGPGFLRREAAA